MSYYQGQKALVIRTLAGGVSLTVSYLTSKAYEFGAFIPTHNTLTQLCVSFFFGHRTKNTLFSSVMDLQFCVAAAADDGALVMQFLRTKGPSVPSPDL